MSFPKGKMLLATRITALARIWAWEAGLPPLAGTLYLQLGSRKELTKAAEVMRALWGACRKAWSREAAPGWPAVLSWPAFPYLFLGEDHTHLSGGWWQLKP